MIKIEFTNQTKSRIESKRYFDLIHRFLLKYGITDNVEVELRIVGSQSMRRLNREYRHKDYATDVLSFPIWPDLDTIKQQSGQILLGSIVICMPVAVRDAKRENQSIEQKIAFLIEHSLLHLLGFHHKGD